MEPTQASGAQTLCWSPQDGADFFDVGQLHFAGFDLSEAAFACSLGTQCNLDLPGHRLAETCAAIIFLMVVSSFRDYISRRSRAMVGSVCGTAAPVNWFGFNNPAQMVDGLFHFGEVDLARLMVFKRGPASGG